MRTRWSWLVMLAAGVGTDTHGAPERPCASETAVEISAGGRHSCARLQGDTVRCWGGFDKAVLAPVIALGSAAQLSAGGAHTCAVKRDGTLWCWGANDDGQLGDGTTTARERPVQVTELGAAVASVAAGDFHTCAAKRDGSLWCWGLNETGQLGDGTRKRRTAPVAVSGLGAVKQAAAGSGSTCAVLEDETLWCWGNGGDGQLGTGGHAVVSRPTRVTALEGVAQVDVGVLQACAVKDDGTLWCWGDGAPGDGQRDGSRVPVPVTALGASVTSVAVGQLHACAQKQDGSLWCWGTDSVGQVGRPPTEQVLVPVRVDALGTSVSQASAGALHSCALTDSGSIWCWGDNHFGQLAEPTTTAFRSTPARIALGCDAP